MADWRSRRVEHSPIAEIDRPRVGLQKIHLNSVEYVPGELLKTVEARLIEQVLQLTKGNKTKAAKILGMSVRTLRYKTSAKEEK